MLFFWKTAAVTALLSLFGCGDGVGQPIREAVVTPPGDVPSGAYCASVVTWSAADAADEQLLASTLNTLRPFGQLCNGGGIGGMPSLPSQESALVMSPELRCAARRHARDMAQQTEPNGETPEARMRLAGYSSSVTSEVTARDLTQASQVLAQQLRGGGDSCATLLDPRLVAVGVGKFQNMWTVDLAGARSP